jgi:hypothetical protein
MHRSITSTIIKPFQPRRLIGASLAVALMLALTMVMTTASASARPAAAASAPNVARATTTVVDKYINVGEGDGLVDANVEVMNGDEVDISVSGSIWAGVWFTGRNGPEGWVGWHAGNEWPLPGANLYSLLGHTAADGYFYVGRGRRWTYRNESLGSGRTRLEFEINDRAHGNGDGSFQVHLIVRR